MPGDDVDEEDDDEDDDEEDTNMVDAEPGAGVLFRRLQELQNWLSFIGNGVIVHGSRHAMSGRCVWLCRILSLYELLGVIEVNMVSIGMHDVAGHHQCHCLEPSKWSKYIDVHAGHEEERGVEEPRGGVAGATGAGLQGKILMLALLLVQVAILTE